MLKLARTISNLFNPLVIFVLIVTALIYYTTGSPLRSFRWFVAAGIFASILTLSILLAVKKKVFTNFDVSQKKDRPLLFLCAGAILVAIIFIGTLLKVEKNILTFFEIGLFGIVIYSLVNRKIKASVHLGVFIMFVSILTFLFNIQFAFLYFLVPILAWARVTEKEHTYAEVVTGSVLGIFLSFCLIFLLQ